MADSTCPKCGAPCKTEILMRGGDHGWSTTDLQRTVYRYQPPAAPAPASTEDNPDTIALLNLLFGADVLMTTGRYLSDHIEELFAARFPAPSGMGVDERKAFEAWALSEAGGWWEAAVARVGDGYHAGAVTKQWIGWQARASLASPVDRKGDQG